MTFDVVSIQSIAVVSSCVDTVWRLEKMTLSDLLQALGEEVQDPEEGNIEIGRGD